MSNLDHFASARRVTPCRQQSRTSKAIDDLAHPLVALRDRRPGARIFLPLTGRDQPNEKASSGSLLLWAELLQLPFCSRRDRSLDTTGTGV
jgi:hypothetical protein